jgi:hypothetical protein
MLEPTLHQTPPLAAPAMDSPFAPPQPSPRRDGEREAGREPRVIRFFTKRVFVMVTTEPIPGARSLQWCLSWAGGVVAATTAFAGFGLHGLSPLLALVLMALQLGVAAYLLQLVGYEERQGQLRPARTSFPTYMTALTGVAATALAGVALFMGGLGVLAKWAGDHLDLVQGLLVLVLLGLGGLAAIVVSATWVVRAVTAKLRLQPGEKAVLVLEATVLVAVGFILLLAW